MRILLKCPACGKVSDKKSFNAGADGLHRLEVLECRSVGGGRGGTPKETYVDSKGRRRKRTARDVNGKPAKGSGFEWTRRAPSRSDLVELATVMRAVADRLLARAAEYAEYPGETTAKAQS